MDLDVFEADSFFFKTKNLKAQVGKWNKLTFELGGAANTYENQSCVFHNPSKNVYLGSNLHSLDDGSFFCYAPALPSAGLWKFYILGSYARYNTSIHSPVCSFNRPESFIAQTTLEVLDSAPKLKKALFSDTGAKVLISFDKPIQVNGLTAFETVPCSRVFDTTIQTAPYSSKLRKTSSNARVYGNFAQKDDDCSVSLQGVDTLVLVISNDFANTASSPLIPNQWLKLKEDAVYEAGGYSDPSSGSIVVSYPVNKPVPVGDILAASVLPLCMDYELDLTSVSGSAGRNWEEVDIAIDSSGGNVNLTSIRAYIKQNTPFLKKGLGSITLPILPGSYNLKITFQNFLGGTNFWTMSVTKYSTNDVPYIILFSDSGTVGVDNSKITTLYAASCKRFTEKSPLPSLI
jgi:hypothetical protein